VTYLRFAASLEVFSSGRSGEIVGLLGPNGAGKTTTFYMTVGLTPPDSGRVGPCSTARTSRRPDVRAGAEGHRVPAAGAVDLPRAHGRAEHPRDPRDAAGRRPERRRRGCDELLAELNLTPLAAAPAYTLSGGERRRVEITRALVISPRFILLDEPFAGHRPDRRGRHPEDHLPPEGARDRRAHHDHNVRETLKITDRAYIVHDGRIFRSGTPESLAGRRGRAPDLSRGRLPVGLRCVPDRAVVARDGYLFQAMLP
jgi:lipopolysaccharide export system ATP-binding protein